MTRVIRLKRSTLATIASIIEFIDAEPLNKKTTEQIAEEYYINRKALQKGFRSVTGMGLKEYQNLKRMEACKELLRQGELSVKQIACICSYKSQRAFSKAFKQMVGVTPTEYQNQAS